MRWKNWHKEKNIKSRKNLMEEFTFFKNMAKMLQTIIQER